MYSGGSNYYIGGSVLRPNGESRRRMLGAGVGGSDILPTGSGAQTIPMPAPASSGASASGSVLSPPPVGTATSSPKNAPEKGAMPVAVASKWYTENAYETLRGILARDAKMWMYVFAAVTLAEAVMSAISTGKDRPSANDRWGDGFTNTQRTDFNEYNAYTNTWGQRYERGAFFPFAALFWAMPIAAALYHFIEYRSYSAEAPHSALLKHPTSGERMPLSEALSTTRIVDDLPYWHAASVILRGVSFWRAAYCSLLFALVCETAMWQSLLVDNVFVLLCAFFLSAFSYIAIWMSENTMFWVGEGAPIASAPSKPAAKPTPVAPVSKSVPPSVPPKPATASVLSPGPSTAPSPQTQQASDAAKKPASLSEDPMVSKAQLAIMENDAATRSSARWIPLACYGMVRVFVLCCWLSRSSGMPAFYSVIVFGLAAAEGVRAYAHYKQVTSVGVTQSIDDEDDQDTDLHGTRLPYEVRRLLGNLPGADTVTREEKRIVVFMSYYYFYESAMQLANAAQMFLYCLCFSFVRTVI